MQAILMRDNCRLRRSALLCSVNLADFAKLLILEDLSNKQRFSSRLALQVHPPPSDFISLLRLSLSVLISNRRHFGGLSCAYLLRNAFRKLTYPADQRKAVAVGARPRQHGSRASGRPSKNLSDGYKSIAIINLPGRRFTASLLFIISFGFPIRSRRRRAPEMLLTTAMPFQERLFQKCLEKFHRQMELSECLPALTLVYDLEKNGVNRCKHSENATIVEHNLDYYSDCSKFEHSISKWIVPFLMMLCFLGNVLNILIYRLPYFDGSSSVHFLRAKALANLIFVLSRIFEVIHAWTIEASAQFELTYWTTKPFVITVANVSGTISTWLTLLVTMETVMCVLTPFSFRQYCTRRLSLNLLIATVVLSSVLHLTFLCTHHVATTTVVKELNASSHCWYHAVYFTMQRNVLPIYEFYEKMYYWIQMTVSIVLPTIIMLICSVLIITQFTIKDLGETFSQRRRCVIRMTVATTLSHLLLEGPALLTFGAAALKGAGSSAHDVITCKLNHGNNLLSMVNATIPFFVFLMCNHQFRHMTTVYLQAQTACESEKKRDLLNQSTVRNRSTRDQEKSVFEQKLLTKVTNI
ncbi:hypothetical protein L596_003453 [Steinernema carpocapsae]|uniref:G-protein coupled receptors family 1 profile domain-containing protein n=1 Tax=Steinernema carpocapsae TaxID=34508 RepID=A0A4U8USR9_STECR|nr:hypothetical protein L596_003453 [Steinernema carpocapsae]